MPVLKYWDPVQGRYMPLKGGPAGPPVEIAVSVETLPPGSGATVVSSGQRGKQQLLFGIPRGDKGEPGELTQDDGDARYLLASTVVVSRPNGTDKLVTISGTVVHYYSGWRDITAVFAGTPTDVRICRINGAVYACGTVDTLSGSRITLPEGFRPPLTVRIPAAGDSTGSVIAVHLVEDSGNWYTNQQTPTTAFALSWPVAGPPPTSLPGTPIGTAP